jgi:hypothetical protein
MIALFILLVVISISLFINRIATKALVLTGLSRDVAELQARSISTGTGFTTQEAESIVNHPARRKLIMPLMLIQNVGLVTVISTLILSFVNTGTAGIALTRAFILVGWIGLLLFLSRSDWVERYLEKFIDWLLDKYTNLKVRDYQSLLNLQQGYTVSSFTVEDDTWLADTQLKELKLKEEGIMVLCKKSRDDTDYTPTGEDTIVAGDTLTVYAEAEKLSELKNRMDDASGDQAHEEASKEYQKKKEAKKT